MKESKATNWIKDLCQMPYNSNTNVIGGTAEGNINVTNTHSNYGNENGGGRSVIEDVTSDSTEASRESRGLE